MELGSDEDKELKHIFENETDIEVHLFDWQDEYTQNALFKNLKETSFVVIIRSPWDYFLHSNRFLTWLRKLQDQKIIIYNSRQIIEWNMHKHYLFELKEWGLPIVPTLKLSVDANLLKYFDEFNCDEIVVKPSISAGSHRTKRIKKSDYQNQETCKSITDELKTWIHQCTNPETGYIVQPFIKDVATLGEVSLLFIEHEFSHACIKKPQQGNWLVQNIFGGTSEPYECSETVLELGQKAIEHIRYNINDGQKLLYARVDMILANGEGTEPKYLLSEIELIEPYFYFDCADRKSVV